MIKARKKTRRTNKTIRLNNQPSTPAGHSLRRFFCTKGVCEKVASGPDERCVRAEKCSGRGADLLAKLSEYVLYYV